MGGKRRKNLNWIFILFILLSISFSFIQSEEEKGKEEGKEEGIVKLSSDKKNEEEEGGILKDIKEREKGKLEGLNNGIKPGMDILNNIRPKPGEGVNVVGAGFSLRLNEEERKKAEEEEEKRQMELRREEERKKKKIQEDKRMENSVKYTKDYWFPGKKEPSDYVERYPKPYGWPPKDKDPKMRTIFISMASYRDPVCPSTLIDLYKQAAFPERIFVGLYQQNSKLEPDCIASLPQKTMRYLNQIRTLRIDYTDADGPCTARYWCSQLYAGEDYFMQIDSHTRFLKDWDVHQIRMWEKLNDKFPEHNRKIVVSTYPIAYNVSEDSYPNDYEKHIPIMCYGKFRDQLIVPAGAMISSGPEVIYESPFIAAGWFFGPGNMLYEVPFDPDLPHVFLGEEVLYSIRLWVAGWRIYNPDLSILAHYYLRSDQPKIWGDVNNFFGKGKAATDTIRRALLFLKDGGPLPKYSPPEEGVKEYYRHFGVDIQAQTFRKICG